MKKWFYGILGGVVVGIILADVEGRTSIFPGLWLLLKSFGLKIFKLSLYRVPIWSVILLIAALSVVFWLLKTQRSSDGGFKLKSDHKLVLKYFIENGDSEGMIESLGFTTLKESVLVNDLLDNGYLTRIPAGRGYGTTKVVISDKGGRWAIDNGYA